MNSKYTKKWLRNQEYQIELRRRILIEHLYDTLEELEGRPIRRSDYGFPFNMLARGINKGIEAFESLVDKVVLIALTKLKKPNQGRKR